MRVAMALLVVLLTGPHGPRFVGTSRPASPKARPPATAKDPFAATVRPILATKCAPCHNPGGQMYARLPFDDPKVVSSHSPGILKRLKGDDRAALEKWLATVAPPAAER